MATITIGRRLSSGADSVTAVQGLAGAQPWLVAEQNQLVPARYDHIELDYHPTKVDLVTGVVYRQGGATGTVVATLALTYDANDNVASVSRT